MPALHAGDSLNNLTNTKDNRLPEARDRYFCSSAIKAAQRYVLLRLAHRHTPLTYEWSYCAWILLTQACITVAGASLAGSCRACIKDAFRISQCAGLAVGYRCVKLCTNALAKSGKRRALFFAGSAMHRSSNDQSEYEASKPPSDLDAAIGGCGANLLVTPPVSMTQISTPKE